MPALQRRLDLDIADNQFVTLLGPRGCGKTTTLRLIAGYMTPDTGTIHVDDRLLSSPDGVVPPEQRGMGMVFQNYAVWPHKTVFENVVFGLKLRKVAGGEARSRVEQALALVNLAGLGEPLPERASGGQQQRVALARSLVVEPEHPAARRAAVAISTPSCASTCAPSSSSCSAAPASPSSMSPTTRPRRWRCPTRSP